MIINLMNGLGNFWQEVSCEEEDLIWFRYTPIIQNVIEYVIIEPTTPCEETIQSYVVRYDLLMKIH